jgi:hypothetical protein
VICGHIHHASDRTFAGIHYLNCGDWVESCTAIVETYEGELRLVAWHNRCLNGRAGTVPETVSAMPLPRQPIETAHARP